MRWWVECQLNYESVESTLNRLSQFFESWPSFYVKRIVSLMKMIVFNSIQVINYWFTLHCTLRPLYQQAQTFSLNIWDILDQNVTVLFVQKCITLNQIRTHWLLYINAILIQSQSVLVFVNCTNCQTHNMTLFLKCHCTSEHFSECCNNCKWRDHTACCSVCNNDVLIVILNNENNNNVNEGEPAAQLRRITLTLLSVRTIIIYVTS